MTRLVTYGCSFTRYYWSTWADILAENLDLELINRGVGGCGNNFMLHRLKHDLQNTIINQGDKIIIMWCYYNRKNLITGKDSFQMVREQTSRDEIKNQFYENKTIIQEAESILIDNNIEYDFLSWSPQEKSFQSPLLNTKFEQEEQFTQKAIHPALVDVVMNGDWNTRTDFAVSFANAPSRIFKNAEKMAKRLNKDLVQLIRDQLQTGDGRFHVFYDWHPTPLMHLEYLQFIYPKMSWKPELIEKIHHENQEILLRGDAPGETLYNQKKGNNYNDIFPKLDG